MLVTNCAGELPNMDSCLVCSGCDRMVAVGAVGHLQLQLVVGRMDANGTVVLVQLQLKLGISPSSNGRERMNVPGNVTHTMQLEDTVTQICSHTSWVVTGRL